MVLGLHSQWSGSRFIRRSSSRHLHYLAIGCYFVRFRRVDVLGSTRVLPPDPTLCSQLLQDFVPKKVGHLVLDLWCLARLLALWSLVRLSHLSQ